MAQNPPLIHSLLLVAIGALLTGGGAIIANQVSEDRKSRHDYEIVRRERIEELYELSLQMGRFESEHSFFNAGISPEKTSLENPIDRIETLVSIYFPDLRDYIKKLRIPSSGFSPDIMDISKEPDLAKKLDRLTKIRDVFVRDLIDFQNAIKDEASKDMP